MSTLDERLAGVPSRADLLSRADLRALGFERRVIDAIWCEIDEEVVIPGYSRPFIWRESYLAKMKAWTVRGRELRPGRDSGRVMA